jgi:hypothetical protein
MSYLGNSPELNAFTVGVEKFNGSGACTVYTLTRDIDDPNYLEIAVNGVLQTPREAYTVTDGVLTFTTPPGLGTNNVVVIYRTGTTIAYNQIAASQLLANSVTATALAPSAVVTSKIAPNAITGDKLADNVISPNNIIASSITANLYGILSVTGNVLGIQAVSGNNIGIGAVSANNFAGGGITSNVLSPNLAISITRVLETANLFTDVSVPPRGNLNIDISNNTLYLFTANTTANVTFNLRGNSVNTFDSTVAIGQTVSVAIGLHHNTNATFGGRHAANVFIDGGLISTNRTDPSSGNIIYYAGNTVPALLPPGILAGQNQQGLEFNLFAITVFKRAANTYTVVQANTLYGLGY